MTQELLSVVSTPWTFFVLALMVFGFAPRLVLRILVFAFPSGDPRRRELIGELDAVPYAQRPLFVAEQTEVALVEGLGGRARILWIRKVTARWSLSDGVAMNREHSTSFWIPSPEEKASVVPGDLVKLAFRTRDDWGERMWVLVQKRTRRGYVGRLWNTPIGIPDLWSEKTVRFKDKHIIDISDPPSDD